MRNCTPRYFTEKLPVDVTICGPDCHGVTFEMTSMTATVLPNGKCGFEWTVTRRSKHSSTPFSDTAVLACPDVRTIKFYCDIYKVCAAFQLTLTCEHEEGETHGE